MKETRSIQLTIEDFAALVRSNHRLETVALFRERERVERELATMRFEERWEKRIQSAEETVRSAVTDQRQLATKLSEKYGVDFHSTDTVFDDETGVVTSRLSADKTTALPDD